MDCVAYTTGRCRSCTLLKVPHRDQLERKQESLAALVERASPGAAHSLTWHEPLVSKDSHFRSKAKMVVGGTVAAPTIGILDADQRGVDLTDCPLYEPALTAAFPALSSFITRAQLEPYDVERRAGELKHLIVTSAPSGEVMVRFVMRSTEAHSRIVKHLPWLREHLPSLVVASLNVLPEHKAVLEGEREILLTYTESLPMRLGDVTLHLRPQSFFQTNTAIARELYGLVSRWVGRTEPHVVWDLYCGVGGFALHSLAPGREVVGIEVSAQAIGSARMSAAEMADAGVPGARHARFEVADATEWAEQHAAPEVVVVNPPRRGLGKRLSTWLERSGPDRVVYSSCNALTLARDLEAMPSLVPVEGRLLDMFPHTEHYEAVLLLERHAA